MPHLHCDTIYLRGETQISGMCLNMFYKNKHAWRIKEENKRRNMKGQRQYLTKEGDVFKHQLNDTIFHIIYSGSLKTKILHKPLVSWYSIMD